MAAAFTGRSKLKKEHGAKVDAVDEAVAQALYDLEHSPTSDLKSDLKDVHIAGAKEIDVKDGKKAVVMNVPVPLVRRVRQVHPRLVRELEKKFSGKHVLIIGARKILPPVRKTNRVARQRRPRSRTLAAVHDAWLEDIVYPTEIVGRRIRVRLDGSKLYKVYLDRKEQQNVEYKLDTFAAVYKKLTGKNIVFEFAASQTD